MNDTIAGETLVRETEYLAFCEKPQHPDRKTSHWAVRAKRNGMLLATIRWYGAWRQYCLYTRDAVIFNRGCLEDINTFIDDQMEAWRSARLERRPKSD